MRRSGIKRKSALKPLGRKGRARLDRSSLERLQRELWRKGLGPCSLFSVVCDGKIDGHHIIPKQTLFSLNLRLHVWDRANRLALCRHHHNLHHARIQPVPRDVLPASVFEFAAALDLEWYLDKHYPAAVSERGEVAERPAERHGLSRSETAGDEAAA